MFSDELEKISWEETTKAIYSKTDADVRRALSKEHCDVNDFMALISPAAAPYLETMARLSRKYTMERFGKTISMFVPLYITNSCTNSCVYCGFNHNNPMKRTILTEEEMVNEYKAIKKLAPFENLLLVTGENPAKAGVDYIERALLLAKPYFANLQIEVMPLKAEEYERLTHAGLNGVICFQETYNKANYNIYHPRGMKSKFEWRVNGFARMKERQFAAHINQKNSAELRQEMNRVLRELDAMKKRSAELSKLFKRLYEDNVLGRVTDEQYRMLSGDYTDEQRMLEEQIPQKEQRLAQLQAREANVDAFIEKAKQYTTIDTLTPELLRLFIQRIEIGERDVKYSRNASQAIRIIYRDIGLVDSAMQPDEQQPKILPPLSEVIPLPA